MCFKCDGIGDIPGVQVVQVIPPAMLEVAVLLREAFLSDWIGVNARANSLGPDYFECPCCGAKREVVLEKLQGKESIDSVEHDGDCALYKVHKLLEALDQTNPVLFAE